jgi:hypothetical protein
MYGPFGMELAKIHIEDLHAEALKRRGDRPSGWRQVTGRALIATGARLARIRVIPVQPYREGWVARLD